MSVDRMLPTQMFNNSLYRGSHLTGGLYSMLTTHGAAVDPLKLEMHADVGMDMCTPQPQIDFLKFYITLTRATRVLEVGTFIGATTIQLAKHIGQQAEIYTIEKFDEFANIAQENFNNNGVAERITLIMGDAVRQMESLTDGSLDLIYIDGDKGRYLDLCRIAERKLAPGGSIIVDDIFFHGDVLNDEPSTEKGRGCKAVLDHYRDTHYNKYLMPINNGLLILQDA